jgi:hypothetical protein
MSLDPGSTREPLETRERAAWRAVGVPTEHGGWSLTIEPVVLGLLVAFSWAGLALGVAALLAFLARTPLKVVLVDRWRHRSKPRTRLAARILLAELFVIVALVVLASAGAERIFWGPLVIAAPLVLLELYYDMRSRGRRLVPELAGTIGIGSVAAATALAGGAETDIALSLWCVIAARSIAAIPYVRTQVLRTRTTPPPLWPSDLAQLCGAAVAVTGWAFAAVPVAAAGLIVVLGLLNIVLVRRPPRAAVQIGIQQLVVGVVVIAVTAIALA